MDVAEPTDGVPVDEDGGGPAGDEIPVVDGLDFRRPPDVPQQAEDERLRCRERGFVVDRGGRDAPDVPRRHGDVRDLEDPLRQLAMFVQAEDRQEGGEHRRPQRGEVLPERILDHDPVRRLERILGSRDGEGHDFLVPVAHEQRAQGLRKVVCGERFADCRAPRHRPRVSIVPGGNREVFREVHLVQEVEPVRRREDRKRFAVRAGVVAHPAEAFHRLRGRQRQPEPSVRAAQVERMRRGGEVRRLERPIRIRRADGLDPTSALRERGREDREAALDRLEVRAGDVEEQVLRVRRELRPDPVDHGRKAEHLSTGIPDDREARLRCDERREFAALVVLRQDLGEVELLREAERREADLVRADGVVRVRRRDFVEVVDSDRDFPTPTAGGEVELFLQIDEGPEQGVVQFNPANDAADRVRTDVRDARINDELDAGRLDPIRWESDLEAEEAAKPAGNPFDGVQVRPVREDVERHHIALDGFRARPHERDPIDALLQAQSLAEEVDQVVVVDVDVRQGRLAWHLAIYKIPRESDILVLAAKPKDMPALVAGIAGHVRRDGLVISLAAGVRTAFIEKALAGRGRVVRIMPNLACAVGEGATAFALGGTATEHDALVVEEIFGAIGRVTMVEEPMLDAVTGLSGSGPGFIAALAHSMIEGGVRSGLPRDVAYKLALQTMKGTAELLLIDGLEPMQLFRMVATPNGTTEAGWAVMEKRGGPPAISDAIVAASKRAADLAAEVAKSHGQALRAGRDAIDKKGRDAGRAQ